MTMARFAADLRYSLRSLFRVPLFTAVAVGSIAFGIGANTAVFTLLDQVVLRQLPVQDPRELVQLSAAGTESYGGTMGDGSELSYAMYRDLRDRNQVLAGMFCRMQASLHVNSGGTTEQVAGELVSGTFFPLLGLRPAAGRLLDRQDEGAGADRPYAVLSYDYWQARFNGNPDVIGRAVRINGHPFEIVGVVQRGFAGLDIGAPARVYVPITMQPQLGPAWLKIDTRRFRWVQAFGRLRPGVDIAEAQAGLQPLYQALLEQEAADAAFEKASPDTKRRFLEGRLTLLDASRGRSGLREFVSRPLLILMAVAAGVLLIVCANVANLLIARGAARRHEVALRLAVGAGRREIVRLLLVDSLVLGVCGAGAGLLLAMWGASVLLGYYAPVAEFGAVVSAEPDMRILLFTTALALVTTVGAGLVPAFRSARIDLTLSLKGSAGVTGGDQSRVRKTLVAAQVALSLMLLVGAGLFVRSLNNLLEVDPGYRTGRTVSFTFDLSRAGYDTAASHAFIRRFHERISRLPSVASLAYTFFGFLQGGGWSMGFTIEGYQPPQGESAFAMCNGVSPGFFKAMGIRLLAGRDFDQRDDRLMPAPEGWPYRVAIVNQTFADRYFKGENPIGRHIGIGDDPGTKMPIEIVGLIKDLRYVSVREDPVPKVFFPMLQAGQLEFITAYVGTSGSSDAIMTTVRREMAGLDPQIAVYDVATLDERVERSIVNERLIAGLSAALSTIATLLSIVGLYGVMAYTVTRRTREIGIRMALGAMATQVAAGVMREAAVLLIVGLGAGVAAAWALGRYVQAQLYGVSATDPATMAAAAVLLTAVGAIAALLPARRAARVSPMAALREE
jgi:predicted permease